MNIPLAFEIAKLAVSLVTGQMNGKIRQHAEITDRLLKIVQKGV